MGADDIEQNIVITGDASGGIAAVDSTNQAFQRLVATHGELKSVFSERIEHAGIYLFSRQLLDTVGLGQLAQHAFAAINIGFLSVADAAGISAAAMGPVLLVAGAAITAYEKLTKHKVDAAAADEKVVEAQLKDIKSTQDLRDELDAYQSKMGTLTDDLLSVAQATDKLSDAEKYLTALEMQKDLLAQQDAAEEAGQKFNELTARYAAAGFALSDYGVETDGAKQLTLEQSIELQKLQVESEKAEKRIAELTDSIQRYRQTGELTPTGEHLKSSTKDASDAEAAQARLEHARAKANIAAEQAMSKDHEAWLKYQIDLDHARQKADTWGNEMVGVSGRAFGSIEDRSSRAFAQMITEGQTATQAFKNFFRDMATEVISDLIKMIEKQLIFNALQTGIMGFLGGGASPAGIPAIGQQGVPGYAPGVGFGGGPSANFAVGGDFYVDKPTPFVAGEAGLERVTVTPAGGSSPAGGGQGGGNTTINVTVNAQTNADPNQIGQAVIRAIRGQGQLQFLRTT